MKQTTDRGTDHCHGVLRRDRVIQRCRVEHPFQPDKPRPVRSTQHDIENSAWPIRTGETSTHIDQHRVHKTWMIERQTATGVLPAGIKHERLDRVTIRQTMKPLQHHHRRNDLRRDRTTTAILEQISKHHVREQTTPIPMQHRPHRVLTNPTSNEHRRPGQQIFLRRRQPKRHPPSFSYPNTKREHPKPPLERHQPPSSMVRLTRS